MIDTALSYLSAGLSVIPVKPETKAPTITWKPFQSEPMKPDQAYFTFQDVTGIALIAGRVSGNVEIIDFDNHQGDASETLKRFKKLVKTDGLVIQSTPSGGYHIIYRCEKIANNLKLAQKLDKQGKTDTIIETRGEGGYALIAPSPKYKVIAGSLDAVPIISAEWRDDLISAGRTFNEVARTVYQKDTFGRDNDRPGTMYDESADGRDEVPVLLQRAGWQSTDGRHWRRPGKDRGISATWGKCTAGGVPLFYVFSSNAGIFEDQKSYKPFQIFALLAHNGDFEAAARELRQRGFGRENKVSKELFAETMRLIRAGERQPNYFAISKDLDIPEQDVRREVDRIYEQNQDEFNFEKKTDIEKAEIYLRKNWEFRRNVVSQKSEMKRTGLNEWDRLNENTIYREFQKNRIKFTFDKLKSLLRSDFVPDFDPFVAYFNALPPWDGVDYVLELADHVVCDDPEWLAVMLKKHLVRAVRCALEPEYYNRFVFVLQSENQEIGKSYFIRFLNPFGTKYYSEEFLRDDKDSQFRLSENFIYNLEELDTLNKMDVGKLKATISKQGVNERVPYEAQKISLPRRCTFFGSTNRDEFLTDDRNTRWIVFKIENFDRSYSQKINVQDIWSQVWALYNDAEYCAELTPREAAWRDRTNKDYQVQEAERTVILQNIEKATTRDQYMTNVDIMTLIADVTGNKLRLSTSSQKIGRIMSELGFESGQRVINGRNCRVYFAKRKIWNLPGEEEMF
jgi:hypothetical protein